MRGMRLQGLNNVALKTSQKEASSLHPSLIYANVDRLTPHSDHLTKLLHS
ncbi:hypothetical protein TSAR_016522 [Trichomalopsis sarcophagae]|uniref:Uncharacterized protein n=1 Tax=Trichomalopsis sarcophagae TaxID=543379 RepID=A0A232EYV8_9HYME|nr:hypothetical protein TSAR_016522 [Trichomalopsis sarcophagae]